LANITDTFKTNLIAWLGDAQNGIDQFFANVGNFHTVNTNQLCVGATCVTPAQFQAMVAAAGAQTVGPVTTGAPSGSSARGVAGADTTSSTTPESLKVNGNNPAQWPLNQVWNDNLGALFTHTGQSETVYSTTTVDTTVLPLVPHTIIPGPSTSCPPLTRNLSFGSRGADVLSLQKYFINTGLLTADSATGYFGKFTQAAVQSWQRSHRIVSSGTPATTGYGAVGPRTRAALARCN
jgi:putative peptidoglycan binding protein